MVRSLVLAAALFLPSAVVLMPTDALACSKGTCALRSKTQPAGKGVKASQTRSAASASASKSAPASAAQLQKDIDEAIAGRCSCSSAADCTCKKGDCKCPRCRSHHRGSGSVIGPLKSSVDPQVIPAKARRDATAGLFI
jgi:hypothetical protein